MLDCVGIRGNNPGFIGSETGRDFCRPFCVLELSAFRENSGEGRPVEAIRDMAVYRSRCLSY